MSLVGLQIEAIREITLFSYMIRKGDIGVVLEESPGIISVKFPFREAGVNLFTDEWRVIVPTVTKEELDQLL